MPHASLLAVLFLVLTPCSKGGSKTLTFTFSRSHKSRSREQNMSTERIAILESVPSPHSSGQKWGSSCHSTASTSPSPARVLHKWETEAHTGDDYVIILTNSEKKKKQAEPWDLGVAQRAAVSF